MRVQLVLLTLRPPMWQLTHGHHNAMWVRIVNGFVMPIKRCFDTRDATQNTDSSDPKYVVTQVTIENDWLFFGERRFLPTLKYRLLSIWYVITWIVHIYLAIILRTDFSKPDVFVFATVWVRIRIDNHKQDQSWISWIRDTQLPVTDVLISRHTQSIGSIKGSSLLIFVWLKTKFV